MSLIVSLVLAASVLAPRTWHYVRSNSDGSEAEQIVVFRETPTRISVFKGRARCTDAALVTAELDAKTGQTLQLIGGRLNRDGTQKAEGWMTYDRKAGRLRISTGSANAPPVYDLAVGKRWRLYDFDFADLIARPPNEIARRKSIAFDMPLFLIGQDGATFDNLGQARLKFAAAEDHDGLPSLRYRISGPALRGKLGDIWFARDGGHIVEARLPLPNHSEYRDFRLKLVRTGDGDRDWNARITDHWRGC